MNNKNAVLFFTYDWHNGHWVENEPLILFPSSCSVVLLFLKCTFIWVNDNDHVNNKAAASHKSISVILSLSLSLSVIIIYLSSSFVILIVESKAAGENAFKFVQFFIGWVCNALVQVTSVIGYMCWNYCINYTVSTIFKCSMKLHFPFRLHRSKNCRLHIQTTQRTTVDLAVVCWTSTKCIRRTSTWTKQAETYDTI